MSDHWITWSFPLETEKKSELITSSLKEQSLLSKGWWSSYGFLLAYFPKCEIWISYLTFQTYLYEVILDC